MDIALGGSDSDSDSDSDIDDDKLDAVIAEVVTEDFPSVPRQ